MSGDSERGVSESEFVLVHGTGARSDDDRGDRWYQTGSPFQRRLIGAAGQQARRSTIFRWDGLNSERSRRLEAARLGALIESREAESASGGYYLLGHSHGGSVIWHALRDRRDQCAQLRGVVTVGTPFLDFGPSRGALALLVPTLVGLALALMQKGDLGLFVRELPHQWSEGSLATLAAVSALWILAGLATGICAAVGIAGLAGWRRSRQRAEAARRWWREHRVTWHIITAEEDEAVNGLIQVATASPVALARRSGAPRHAAGSDVRPGFRGRLRRLLQPVYWYVDALLWHFVTRRAFGADVFGEALAAVSAVPDEYPASVAALSQSLEDELMEGANRRTAASLEQLRGRLAAPLAGNPLPEDLIELLTDVDSGLLVHTSYFGEAGLQEAISESCAPGLVSATPAQQSQPSARQRRFPVSGHVKLLAAANGILAVLVILVLGWLGESLFRARVFPQTLPGKIETISSTGRFQNASEAEGLRRALLVTATGPGTAAGPVAAYIRSIDVGDPDAVATSQIRLAALALGAGLPLETSTQPSAEPTSKRASAFGSEELLEGVVSELMAAGLHQEALDLLFDVEDNYDLPGTLIGELLASVYIDRYEPGKREGTPFDVLDLAVEAAERGDLEGLEELFHAAPSVSRERLLGDFTDVDDFMDKVGETCLAAVQGLASSRGTEIAVAGASILGNDFVSGCEEDRLTSEAESPDGVPEAAGLTRLWEGEVAALGSVEGSPTPREVGILLAAAPRFEDVAPFLEAIERLPYQEAIPVLTHLARKLAETGRLEASRLALATAAEHFPEAPEDPEGALLYGDIAIGFAHAGDIARARRMAGESFAANGLHRWRLLVEAVALRPAEGPAT